jgi:hypothetical protein
MVSYWMRNGWPQWYNAWWQLVLFYLPIRKQEMIIKNGSNKGKLLTFPMKLVLI